MAGTGRRLSRRRMRLYTSTSIRVGNQSTGTEGAGNPIGNLVGRTREAVNIYRKISPAASTPQTVRANRASEVPDYSTRRVESKAELPARTHKGSIGEESTGSPSTAGVRKHGRGVLAEILYTYVCMYELEDEY